MQSYHILSDNMIFRQSLGVRFVHLGSLWSKALPPEVNREYLI